MPKSEADTYAKQVVAADFEEPGSEDVVRKVSRDFASRNIKVSDEDIREEMTRLYGEALKQVAKEFPSALGADHERVGG